MSSVAGSGKRLKVARRTCAHSGALWQAWWKHAGANDRRVGKCLTCGLDVQQLVPCPAQLRMGACRDIHGPAAAAKPPAGPSSPWAIVPAQTWWARLHTWLLSLVGRGGAA